MPTSRESLLEGVCQAKLLLLIDVSESFENKEKSGNKCHVIIYVVTAYSTH